VGGLDMGPVVGDEPGERDQALGRCVDQRKRQP
jgi:hypothetical protein